MKALHPGLFTGGVDSPRLLGSLCQDCAAVMFPQQLSCSQCCSQEVNQLELAQCGSLWSWTIQRFRPKTPYLYADERYEFEPYGVGYVELPGQTIVESILTISEPSQLRIGMPMKLVVYPLQATTGGDALLHFAFAPDE